ncbi:MAG TPA: carboxymuconolactone decarboxylase family protein [Polyangiales bacterium]|nr:carboxymuconolactone decarboxylase family protein [Polyangiales bacterium]
MQRNNKIVSWLIAALLVGVTFGGVRADAGQDAAEATRKDIAKTLGFVPRFFQVMADAAVSGMWTEMKGLQLNPNSALPGKTKELVGLAVAAQVPCRYCISAHTEFAKLNGASEAEIAEAVAVGALARQFSAYTNGLSVDEATFQSDLRRMLEAKPGQGSGGAIAVTDAASARKDIEQTLGFVPAFLAKIPETALPGAWRELKELRLSNTTLSGKVKALIALAVASQIPSRMCIAAETELSKRNGASEREVAEAVGMAAITRNMSTLLNGQQTDEKQFNADIARLVNGAKAAQKLAAKK